MAEQEKPAGWKVWIITRRDKSGAILEQKIYYVAIPDKDEMLDTVCRRLTPNANMLGHYEPLTIAQLEAWGLKTGEIRELMVTEPH